MARQSIILRIQRPAPRDLSPGNTITLPIAELRPAIRIAHRYDDPIFIYPERIILDHQLQLFNGGRCRFTSRDCDVVVDHGQLLFIPPFLPHAFHSAVPVSQTAVHFDLAPGVPRFFANPERRKPYQVRFAEGFSIPLLTPIGPADGIAAGLQRLVDAWSGGALGQLIAHAELFSIMSRLLTPRKTVGKDADGLERARDLMATRYGGPLTIADLARTAGLSPSRFRFRFHAWSGYAPMDYLRRLRVERAKELLADPRLSIREIAARVGLDDQYHFSRVFRRIDGLAPSEFRKAVLRGGSTPG